MRMIKALAVFGGLLVSANQIPGEQDAASSDALAAMADDDEGEDVEEERAETERTRLKAFKNGGFVIAHRKRNNDEVDVNAVFMRLDYLWEKDEEGNAVGIKAGNRADGAENNHGDGRFWNRGGLTFEVKRNVTIGEARGHQITYSSEIEGVGDFKMELYLLEEEGEIGPDLSNTAAARWDGIPGTVKFNVVFDSWKFCGTGENDVPCGDKEGKFIDVQMRVQAASRSFKRSEKPRGTGERRSGWELGDNMALDLTSEVLADGELSNMPEGYPKLEENAGKWRRRPFSTLTFRFPKFAESMVYDPVVEESEESGAFRTFGVISMLAFIAAVFN